MSEPAKAQVSSPRTQRKRPADFTGIQAEKLGQELKEQQEEAAQNMAMVGASKAAAHEGIISHTGADTTPGIESMPVEINDPYRTMMVNTPIENMTYGKEIVDPGDPENGIPPLLGEPTNYNFEPGQKYRERKDLVEHLERLGYISYMGT